MAKLEWIGPGCRAARWYGKRRIAAVREMAEQLAAEAHPDVKCIRVQLDHISGQDAMALINVFWDGVCDVPEPRSDGDTWLTKEHIVDCFAIFVEQYKGYLPSIHLSRPMAPGASMTALVIDDVMEKQS